MFMNIIKIFIKRREITSNIKTNQIKKGDFFSDGNIVKKKYFFDNDKDYIIYLNQDNQIQYKLRKPLSNEINKIAKLGFIKGQLEILFAWFRKDLNLQLANVYKLGLLGEADNAIYALEILEREIENRKKLLKKFFYLITPILISILFYLSIFILEKIDYLSEYYKYRYIILFSGIGSFLSISININSIEFNTSETPIFYFCFAFFKYLHSIFSSILLILLYKSKIINIEINTSSEDMLFIILATLGGFSGKLIPNIFDKISRKLEDNT